VAASLYDAGYGSSRAFYEQATVQLAMNPRRYRAGGAGEEIAFTTFPTALGPVLAAATTRGVCAVRLGPDAGALEAELVAEFPRADVARDDEALSEVAQLITALARGESPSRELPLDLRGTAFQVKVWEALRAIPRGTTRSYARSPPTSAPLAPCARWGRPAARTPSPSLCPVTGCCAATAAAPPPQPGSAPRPPACRSSRPA
jgi:AraC family transcriptional regulator of adaptative response/methylated-DNA-[protein]-cysteine methyltransferase